SSPRGTGSCSPELVPLHPTLTVGGPLGIGIVDEENELPCPVRSRVRAVGAIDVDARYDTGIGEAEPPLVTVPLVETKRLSGLEAGRAVLVRPALRSLGAHVATLRVLDHD